MGAEEDAGPTDAGAEDVGVGDTGVTAPDPLFGLVGGILATNPPSSYISVSSDFSAVTQVDLASALTVPGIPTFGFRPGTGTLFLSDATMPVIRRFQINSSDDLEETGSVNLAAFVPAINGLISVIDDTKAYYIDLASFTVIVFNPDTMQIVNDFALDGIAEDNLNEASRGPDAWNGRLVLRTRFFREDGSAEILTKVTLIDPATDTYVVREQRRCANIDSAVVGGDGNLYMASHTSQATRFAAGLAGTPAGEPCMVRLDAQTMDYDPNYLVMLNMLNGGLPSGFILPGGNGRAYVLGYEGEAITPENEMTAGRSASWSFFALDDLSNPTATSKVAGLPAAAAWGFAAEVRLGTGPEMTPLALLIAPTFASGTFYDISDPANVLEVATQPGFPVFPVRLR